MWVYVFWGIIKTNFFLWVVVKNTALTGVFLSPHIFTMNDLKQHYTIYYQLWAKNSHTHIWKPDISPESQIDMFGCPEIAIPMWLTGISTVKCANSSLSIFCSSCSTYLANGSAYSFINLYIPQAHKYIPGNVLGIWDTQIMKILYLLWIMVRNRK